MDNLHRHKRELLEALLSMMLTIMTLLQAGSLGPPYGLLQGSLAEIDGLPPREGNLVARSVLPWIYLQSHQCCAD